MNTLTRTLFVSVLVLFPMVLFAGKKPDFTGQWELNVQKSDLGGAPMTKLTVHIEHKDPTFTYTAKATVNGQDFDESETFKTDGTPAQDSRGATVRAHWENETLVIESTAADGSPLDETHITLSADGNTTTRDYENKVESQKRHEIYDKH